MPRSNAEMRASDYDFDGSSNNNIQNERHLATSRKDGYAEEACLYPLNSR